MDSLQQLEIILILFLQSLGSWLTDLMRLFSMLGQEDFFLLVMPALYWSLDAGLGLRVAIMLLLSNQVNCFFKLAFHSSRPYWLDPHVRGIVAEESFGFPSGHAQNAASIWGMMVSKTSERWGKIALVIIIFCIGFSRLVLGVHFVRDVIAGWLIGGLLLWLILAIERPVSGWLRKRTFAEMLALCAASSALLVVIGLLPLAALGGWQTPVEWARNALISQPDYPIDPLNISAVFTVAGTWLGMMIGAAWFFHYRGGFDASGSPMQKMLRYPVGVVGLFIFWYVLGKVFPNHSDVLSYGLRFFRYTLVSLWVSALAPLLFEQLGLAHSRQEEVTPFSSTENPL